MTDNRIPNVVSGILYASGAGLGWAVMDAAVKKLLHSYQYTFWELTFIRSFLGLVGVLLYYVVRYAKLPPASNKRLLMVRGINGALVTLSIFYALESGPLSTVTVLVKTSTLWTALFAWLYLSERLSVGLIAALVMGIGGVYEITGGRMLFSSEHLGSYSSALLGAVLLGVTSVVLRTLQKTENSYGILVFFLGVSACISAPMAFPMQGHITFDALVWIVPMVIFGVLGQLCLTQSFRYAPASVAYPFSLTEVVGAMLFGVILFDESFTIRTLIGSSLIIVSCIWIGVLQRR